MELVLTYVYDDGLKREFGILEYENGVLRRGDILCGETDVITVISSYVATDKVQYGRIEDYRTDLETLRFKFATGNFNYDTILKYAKKCDISLIDLMDRETYWYIFNSAEDVVNYLCDNNLIDTCIVDVWNNHGIDCLNCAKLCEEYTVSKLDGMSCTDFLYDEEDKVWIDIIMG